MRLRNSAQLRRRTHGIAPAVPKGVATVVFGDFEWEDEKAQSNLVKHGVDFAEAALAMKDPLSLDFDDLHDASRLITLAASLSGRILYIVSTVRDDRLRIVSARVASSNERRRYEKEH